MTKQLRDLLSRLRAQEGVELAAAVATDGLLIESAARPGLEVEAIAAVASNGLAMAEALGREIDKGGTKQTILQYQSGLVLIEPLNNDAMVVLVASNRESLGRLRFLLDIHRHALNAALRHENQEAR